VATVETVPEIPLRVKALRSGYRGIDVLHGVNLDVREGKIYAVLGKNGMGKTTLLKTIMGLLPIRDGYARILGADITGWPTYRIVRQGVSYVPQEQAIFQDLNVGENLRVALGGRGPFSERFRKVADLFPVLGGRLHQVAGTLSGGEQKMLLLARALLTNPKLILIDEISEGLQPAIVRDVQAALLNVCRQRGTTILLVEQNVRFAFSLADRYAILNLGEIVEEGKTGGNEAVENVSRHLTI
jgi:ABC-type branched-subunit amino acid transport system ATPase component